MSSGPKPGLAFSFLSEFQETKKNPLLDAGHVNVICHHRLENPTTMTCYSLSKRISSISLAKENPNTKDASQQQKKTQKSKSILRPPPCHHPGSTPSCFIFFGNLYLPTPKTKKNLRLLPWPIGCQTLPHRHPDIMMPQRQECPPRSTQRHRGLRGSVDPPRPPPYTSGRIWDGVFLLGGVQLQQQNWLVHKKKT